MILGLSVAATAIVSGALVHVAHLLRSRRVPVSAPSVEDDAEPEITVPEPDPPKANYSLQPELGVGTFSSRLRV